MLQELLGRIRSHSLPGYSAERAPRRIDVLVPPDYNESHLQFPVIYMNDGDTAFSKGGLVGQSWDIPGRLERLYAQKHSGPLIVVAIYPLDRNREYTHAPWNDEVCCGLEPYANYLAEVVKPFVDRTYRTLAEARRSMILGSSHGGLAAFYTASLRPDCFGYAGALSPSFWVGLDDAQRFPLIEPRPDRELKDSQLLRSLEGNLADSRIRPDFYLSWGLVRSGGLHNQSLEERATARGREMALLLEREYEYRSGANLIVHEDPDGCHDEQSWGRQIPKIVAFFERE